ncbi:hypothetical protein [Streptomyces hoynatensis]|uniref:Uncharacterized protein n=1 Tax=Streptomyces hoynatensis TaxID=1141874 RepID=A0A3A9YY19_9ACTN|nr:hypothetical protein [Streptomyces hoynatensis]RKN40780.1 hypothetical protein D7294_16970 [Streptomyces hoynatensis]
MAHPLLPYIETSGARVRVLPVGAGVVVVSRAAVGDGFVVTAWRPPTAREQEEERERLRRNPRARRRPAAMVSGLRDGLAEGEVDAAVATVTGFLRQDLASMKVVRL